MAENTKNFHQLLERYRGEFLKRFFAPTEKLAPSLPLKMPSGNYFLVLWATGTTNKKVAQCAKSRPMCKNRPMLKKLPNLVTLDPLKEHSDRLECFHFEAKLSQNEIKIRICQNLRS
jgi:hypothetical protein